MQQGGDDLISIPVASPRAAQALAKRLRENGSWTEVVAGIEAVIVQFDLARTDWENAQRAIGEVVASACVEKECGAPAIEIPIVYGGEFGPDLPDVCQQLGLTEREFVALHTSREYEIDMLGFTPGFAYIGGLDERLNVPRLSAPRVRVPSGSVGIADDHTGIYALQGPGGWPIVGKTDATLFDPESDEPFALRAGCKVRFVQVQSG